MKQFATWLGYVIMFASISWFMLYVLGSIVLIVVNNHGGIGP